MTDRAQSFCEPGQVWCTNNGSVVALLPCLYTGTQAGVFTADESTDAVMAVVLRGGHGVVGRRGCEPGHFYQVYRTTGAWGFNDSTFDGSSMSLAVRLL